MERVLIAEKPKQLTIPAIATIRTLAEFAKATTSGKEVPIPRTSLAITAAILAAFPEEIDTQVALEKVSRLSPFMIALNERADIGVSAELRIKKGNLTQHQFWGLIMLEGQTKSMLVKRKTEFTQKYPQEEKTIQAIEEDFLTLSRLRDEFSPQEWPQFLELDSAIFVCAFIHGANPKTLEKAGIHFELPAKNKEELIEKYRIFLTNQTDSLDEIQKNLRSVFAAEMLLKIKDDHTDEDNLQIDAILGLPSFARWAKVTKPDNPNLALKERVEKYQKEAERLFPRIFQFIAEFTCHATSVIKAKKSQDGIKPTDDPTNFWSSFAEESQTTTLRHKLEASCVLSELFK